MRSDILFCSQFANATAHTVARMGGSMSGRDEWRNVPPPWLFNALSD